MKPFNCYAMGVTYHEFNDLLELCKNNDKVEKYTDERLDRNYVNMYSSIYNKGKIVLERCNYTTCVYNENTYGKARRISYEKMKELLIEFNEVKNETV